MRWALEYTLASGTVGLMIFTAEDETAAEEYVTELLMRHGHSNVSRPIPLPIDAAVADLYRLFPRLAEVVQK